MAVPPDNVPAYAEAIVKLADDAAFYANCVTHCAVARAQFLDEHRGWGAALETAVKAVLPLKQFAK